MIHHPLTDRGILQFRKDWEAAQTPATTVDDTEDGRRGK
jgi:hypothetical protein